MPDYTSILRRSISALPDSSPGMRQAVYERARAALGRQLTAVEPPLSTREIEAQHQELEDAIARLEADYAPSDQEEMGSETDEYRSPYRDGPPASGAAASVTPAHDGDPRGYDGEENEEDDFAEEGRRSRTPLIAAVLVLLAVLGASAWAYTQRDTIMASLGLSGSAEQGEGEDEPPIQVVTPVQRSVDAEPVATGAAGPDKRLDRLTNGPDAAGEEPDAASPGIPGVTPPPAEPADDPLGQLAAADPNAPGEPVSPPGAAPAAEPAPPEPAPPPGQQAAVTPAAPTEGLVAQRAIYYFQGTEGQPGRAAEGNATWNQITRDDAPAVQATLRLKDQDVVTTVTVYKNSDPNLPASHLVEVQFQGSLGPSPIQRVPALVLKQTEQARGQPLTGAAVPVTPDLFWIALADDPAQSARNLQLLREGSWFDIPILFNDGTRALLTFEKGIPGDRIFETVLAAWTPT